jgi:hypothetical protein
MCSSALEIGLPYRHVVVRTATYGKFQHYINFIQVHTETPPPVDPTHTPRSNNIVPTNSKNQKQFIAPMIKSKADKGHDMRTLSGRSTITVDERPTHCIQWGRTRWAMIIHSMYTSVRNQYNPKPQPTQVDQVHDSHLPQSSIMPAQEKHQADYVGVVEGLHFIDSPPRHIVERQTTIKIHHTQVLNWETRWTHVFNADALCLQHYIDVYAGKIQCH